MLNKHTERIIVGPSRVVVPPFECAWLADGNSGVKSDRVCVIFEVMGETDATIILRTNPDSRRWQHSTSTKDLDGSPSSESYTVIIGSNRNSLLTIERAGAFRVHDKEPWTRISQKAFKKFWIFYEHGSIYVGTGELGNKDRFHYIDPNPVTGIRHVGMSSWDKHIIYKNIRFEDPSFAIQKIYPPNEEEKVLSLRKICMMSLLKNLSVESAAKAACLVSSMDFPNSGSLLENSTDFLSKNFECLLQNQRSLFNSLPGAVVSKILQSSSLVSREIDIFYAASEWAFYGEQRSGSNIEVRDEGELNLVFSCVRFALMEEEELNEVLCNPLIFRYPSLIDFVNEGKAAQIATLSDSTTLSPMAVTDSRRMNCSFAPSDKFCPRAALHSVELHYSYNGDSNGVFYYLGTHCSRDQWVNPMTLKMVQVKGSSPSSRFTVPKGIVGNVFQRTNYVGPQRREGRMETWWEIDLLEHVLICNYYTLRQDGSSNFLRSWNLQGSNDRVVWANLRVHENDKMLALPGIYGSWPITCHAKAYRIFRVLLTGPTESMTNRNNICLSNMELYGMLISHNI